MDLHNAKDNPTSCISSAGIIFISIGGTVRPLSPEKSAIEFKTKLNICEVICTSPPVLSCPRELIHPDISINSTETSLHNSRFLAPGDLCLVIFARAGQLPVQPSFGVVSSC